MMFALTPGNIGGLIGSFVPSIGFIWLFSFLLRKIFKNKIPHVLLFPIAAVIFLGLMSAYIYFLNLISITTYLISSIIICIIEFIAFKIKNRKTTPSVVPTPFESEPVPENETYEEEIARIGREYMKADNAKWDAPYLNHKGKEETRK